MFQPSTFLQPTCHQHGGYLSAHGRPTSSHTLHPLQRHREALPPPWLRFVTFAICGVRGDLSATPNGPPVDYDSISLDDPLAEAYYYTPEGIFADPTFVFGLYLYRGLSYNRLQRNERSNQLLRANTSRFKFPQGCQGARRLCVRLHRV